jgi:hypothetical protein
MGSSGGKGGAAGIVVGKKANLLGTLTSRVNGRGPMTPSGAAISISYRAVVDVAAIQFAPHQPMRTVDQ